MQTQSDLPSESRQFLQRLANVLLVLFAVNATFAMLPLRLLEPAWQLRVTSQLLTTTPFVLLGCALFCVVDLLSKNSIRTPGKRSLRIIHKTALYVAIGFFLLIPLQVNASWAQLRQADSETQKTLRGLQQRVEAVRAASSVVELQKLAQGLPQDWQPSSNQSLALSRGQLLARIEPQVALIRTQAAQRRSAAVDKATQTLLRDCAISFLYGYAFLALHQRRPMPEDFEDFSDFLPEQQP
jgi:hypothetical protein